MRYGGTLSIYRLMHRTLWYSALLLQIMPMTAETGDLVPTEPLYTLPVFSSVRAIMLPIVPLTTLLGGLSCLTRPELPPML